MLYLKPQDGRIAYFDIPHRDLSSRRLSKLLSLVPQKPEGGAALTVIEMITLGRLPHMESRWSGFSAEDREVVGEFMEKLGLVGFEHRNCHSLSGGEFQKVLLARALVQKSSILLLDEATANLDLHHSVDIMDLVRQFADGGGAVVAVMHDLNLAARFCDRVVLMKSGEVKYEGKPAEVYRTDVIREIYEIDAYIARDDDGIPFVLPRRNGAAVSRLKENVI
jgi:iron complex transport system ATP-binding protein